MSARIPRVSLRWILCAGALLVFASAGCGKHKSAQQIPFIGSGGLQAIEDMGSLGAAPSTEIPLDDALAELKALKTPDGVNTELFQQLKDELAKQLTARGVSRIASTPPEGPSNRIDDLELADNGDGTFTLTWHYRNLGDYDQDGTVGISDITPLAQHYGETYDIENGNSLLAVIDGSGNGSVGIEDITQIATYYATNCMGYKLQEGDTAEGEFTTFKFALLSEATGQGRISFSVRLTSITYLYARLVPSDKWGTQGDPSEPLAIPGHSPEIASISPVYGLEGETIEFTSEIYGTLPIAYSWDFEDGAEPSTSSLPEPIVVLGAVGEYSAVLSATNTFGADELAFELSVAPAPPQILGIDPTQGKDEETVQFSAAVTGTEPLTYAWDFGGGATPDNSSEPSPTVTLGAVGEYDAHLTLTNAVGEDVLAFTLTVVGRPPFIQHLEGKTKGRPGEEIALTAQVTGTQPISYHWDFGGGAEPNTSADEAPTAILGPEGTYYATITVTNAWGEDSRHFYLKSYNQWVHTWGGSGEDRLCNVAKLSNGNVCATGWTKSFGTEWEDVMVLTYDSEGNILWKSVWGEDDRDAGVAVAVDSTDNIYVAGCTNGFGAGLMDVLVLKYDSSGNLLWTRTWGSTGHDQASAIAVNEAGDVYVTGETQFILENFIDVVLLKYDSDGNLLWQRTWGSDQQESGWALALDSSGAMYVAGIIVGVGAGKCDALVAKFDADGSFLWARTFGGQEDEWICALAVGNEGNVYAAGATDSFGAGNRDILLFTYDSGGNLLVGNTWGKGPSQWAYGISLSLAGEIYLCAGASNIVSETWDAVWAKFSLDWEYIDGFNWDSGGTDEGFGIVPMPNGKVFLAGYAPSAYGTWDVEGGITLVPAGTETSPDIESFEADGTETIPEVESREPEGVEDEGAGATDALVMMIDPRWF